MKARKEGLVRMCIFERRECLFSKENVCNFCKNDHIQNGTKIHGQVTRSLFDLKVLKKAWVYSTSPLIHPDLARAVFCKSNLGGHFVCNISQYEELSGRLELLRMFL